MIVLDRTESRGRRKIRLAPNAVRSAPFVRLARVVLTEAFATLMIEVKDPGKMAKQKRENEVKQFFFSRSSKVDTWAMLALFDPGTVRQKAKEIIAEKERHDVG
jgi:hypothetical protein